MKKAKIYHYKVGGFVKIKSGVGHSIQIGSIAKIESIDDILFGALWCKGQIAKRFGIGEISQYIGVSQVEPYVHKLNKSTKVI